MGFMNISDGLNSRRRERARQLVWSRIRRAKRSAVAASHSIRVLLEAAQTPRRVDRACERVFA